jgi:16S rRNA (adenine1518-N6/adenine1519-N6)-dimethyltransferase
MAPVLRVPPGAFTPPPKVDSAVVRMAPLGGGRLRAKDESLFGRIVAAAFSQRRKMLRGALRGIVGPEAFDAARIDASRRGETLSVREFVVLADAALTRAG